MKCIVGASSNDGEGCYSSCVQAVLRTGFGAVDEFTTDEAGLKMGLAGK